MALPKRPLIGAAPEEELLEFERWRHRRVSELQQPLVPLPRRATPRTVYEPESRVGDLP